MGTVAEKASKTLDTKRKIAAAIEEKTGENPGNVFANYPDAIRAIPTGSGSGWTGHADVEGLKAIGWTDEDIAYYQQHGVNWNEEDDAFHKVPEDNKALYGVINIDNIQDYKDILVYLPKIDIGGKSNIRNLCQNLFSLAAVPSLDFSSVTLAYNLFANCYSLTCVPPLYFPDVTNIGYLVAGCTSLIYSPVIIAPNAGIIYVMYSGCYSLIFAPSVDASRITSLSRMYENCYSLIAIDTIDMSTITDTGRMLSMCYSLRSIKLTNLKTSIDISATSLLEKSSLLYMIENAAPTDSITITLSAYCYNKYSADPDVVAALSAQPLVSLASA